MILLCFIHSSDPTPGPCVPTEFNQAYMFCFNCRSYQWSSPPLSVFSGLLVGGVNYRKRVVLQDRNPFFSWPLIGPLGGAMN